MTSSPSARIIRGAEVDGVIFCTPGGSLDRVNPVERQEKDNLRTLEEFWRTKGYKEGEAKGYEAGLKEGESTGRKRGVEEGLKLGREEGLAQGKEEGLQEGSQAAEVELREAITLAVRLAHELRESKEVLWDQARAEIIHFSLRVCETLLRRQLTDPDTFRGLVGRLLEHAHPIMKDSVVDVAISPEEFVILEPHLSKPEFNSHQAERIHWFADGNLKTGDCRIETPLGLVNFDITRMLADIETKVLEVKSVPESEHGI